MAHPELNAQEPWAVEPLFLTDEEGRTVCVPLVSTVVDTQGRATTPTPDRLPPVGGEWHGDPATSSLKYEPQMAFTKPSTDVVLIGSARAPNGVPVQSLDVGIKVGPIQKVVRVFGDRYWVKTGGAIMATTPKPFETMPLVYERAFGGWDKANKDETRWTVEPRNPIGRGFGDPLRYVEEGKVPMPNIEDPNNLIKRYGDAPPPTGLGFVSPHWHPRAKYAGTYDDQWDKQRKPLLPKDFDRRFFNAASPGLTSPSHLRGDEEVVVVNAAAVTPLRFKLPGLASPICRIAMRNGRKEVLRPCLDTVIVNTDEMRVVVMWRSYLLVPNGPHDVLSISVMTEQALQEVMAAENAEPPPDEEEEVAEDDEL